MGDKPRLFLAHSSKDHNFVEKLANDLTDLDIGVWYDEWEIKVGDSIVDKINHGIKGSEYLAIVLSKESVNSEWVRIELNAGIYKELEEKKVCVLPVLIEDCERPPLIKDKKYADFRGSYDIGLTELLKVFIPDNSFTRFVDKAKTKVETWGKEYPQIPFSVIGSIKEILGSASSGSIGGTVVQASSGLATSSGYAARPIFFLQEFVKEADPTLRDKYFAVHTWVCKVCKQANIDPYSHCFKCGAPKP